MLGVYPIYRISLFITYTFCSQEDELKHLN